MYEFADKQDPSDSALLKVASTDPLAAAALQNRLLPILQRYARLRGWGLAPDLREEVVQQAWLGLMSRSNEAWLSGRVSRNVYIRGIVRDAAETIRSQYRAAGEESRPRNGRCKTTGCARPLDAKVDLADVAGNGDVEQMIHARLELQSLFERATSEIRKALRLICDEGATLEVAAAAVGLTRRTLSRRLEYLRAAA